MSDTGLGTRPSVRVEIIAYAPTEFFHCQHCELVFNQVDFGRREHAHQRETQLPPELMAEYQAIADWAEAALQRYGEAVQLKLVDAVSIEGVLESIRHRSRRFPVFVVNGERYAGFDPAALDRALETAFEGR
ncbi:MAG: hypothetical protein JO247_02665 [Chloroflexi bacterium]|nr:hypothetical protein [Chloroflexota bacterium]